MTSTPQSDSASITTALETLGRLSLRDLDLQELLQTVTELACVVTPGEPEASVTLLVKGHPSTVASSGELAKELDERQYERGSGPCLHGARTGEVVEVTDTRTESRWTEYCRRASEVGCLSSLSIPLSIAPAQQVTGALNIYAREPRAFDRSAVAAAVSFGAYAEVATSNLHAYRAAQEAAENLRVALESRATIDQAKGILMERHRLTADQAFQVLAQASMATNVKVRDVADHLVATGELPSRHSLRH